MKLLPEKPFQIMPSEYKSQDCQERKTVDKYNKCAETLLCAFQPTTSLIYLVHHFGDIRDLALYTVQVSKKEQRFLLDGKVQTSIHKIVVSTFFIFNQHWRCHSLLDLPTLG